MTDDATAARDPALDALIQRALAEQDLDYDELTERPALAILQVDYEPSDAVFAAAEQLSMSANANERTLAASILGQLRTSMRSPVSPYKAQSVPILLRLLTTDTDPDVLCSAAISLGRMEEPSALEPTLALKNHPHEDARFGAAFSLCGNQHPAAVAALIELSSDEDRDVRDWATFGLGRQIELDTPEIRAVMDTPAVRDALAARLTDDDPEVRGEALLGLALRHDPRVIPAIERELAGEFHGVWAVEAAGIMADARFLPLIDAVWERLEPEDQQRFNNYFDEARAACALPSETADD